MKVLVVGATGKYAGRVVPELKKRGATVRALLREAKSEGPARTQGADEIALGDLSDAASLRAAAQGVEGVFHINPAFSPDEAAIGPRMVEAAKAAGVRKFVFSGAIHPSISRMSNHASKQATEQAIYESGMIFTVLQPTMFMQTLANSWKEVESQGRFSLPYSKEKKASYVDYPDVAEAAAIALTSHTLHYGTFQLCAPGMLNRFELVQIMSQALGRTIEAASQPSSNGHTWRKSPQGRSAKV
jgi:uncharacterized protein YbjT (DUF2867 family)